ncbi:hypothetical protein JYG23_04485 [Sedimentibacter sp. zth1]|uniref:hypothetical protein n=1 Tax=Sedimentibacter sp. zth1 TaxID=2816908 RepID=UPI001A931659|nr:hypothetical protein [Sedimentibacter sp. zth1]QSX06714.1 hypothetical protein JYG23_04485 [Sedimentibacter sp. zth1]
MSENDWRITNQKNYLQGVKLNKMVYELEAHNHCAFCWDELKKGDVAYATIDEYHWVCNNCYDDFVKEFQWK